MKVWNSTIERCTPLRSKTSMKRGGKPSPGTPSAEKPIYGPRSGKITRVCKQCAKPFTAWRSAVAKACSRPCAQLLRRTRVTRTCKECSAEFKVNPSQFRHYKGAGQFCSKPCHARYKVKANAGKPATDRYGRTYREADAVWATTVKERDNYTCQRCGVKHAENHAHHVAPRSRRPDLKYFVDNGKTLCSSCHTWVHHHPKEATALGLLSDASYESHAKRDPIPCSVCGSTKRHAGYGFCIKHYKRFKKYGDPLLTKPKGGPGHTAAPQREDAAA